MVGWLISSAVLAVLMNQMFKGVLENCDLFSIWGKVASRSVYCCISEHAYHVELRRIYPQKGQNVTECGLELSESRLVVTFHTTSTLQEDSAAWNQISSDLENEWLSCKLRLQALTWNLICLTNVSSTLTWNQSISDPFPCLFIRAVVDFILSSVSSVVNAKLRFESTKM